ncbi:MAG: PAS domain S-box protein [Clostridiales bacterium]|nr:PAS domain S-box protein [Clostridiales bacterium]MCF8022305.1 PAS domain S-box protein [Clostridiales bacterium]
MYRTIFENTGTAMMIGEKDTTISLVNAEFEQLSGYSKKEIEKKKSWKEFIYKKEDLEMMKDFHILRKIDSEKTPRKYGFKFIDRFNNIKDIMMTIDIIPSTKKHVGSLLDITEQVKLNKELNRLERLNMIGQMAAGLAHEIRNPMSVVRGLSQILMEKEDCALYKDKFDLIINEIDNADYIIKQFLSLAKDKPVNKKMQNLNIIIKYLYPLMNSIAMEMEKCIYLQLKTLPDLLLDENEIQQLILNLVRNGLEAMESGEFINISTFMHGNKIILQVEDQGEGFHDGVIEKIGTPFFTTKDNGTGLGLAICYSIAQRHKADIKVETGYSGTKFLVRFNRIPAT